VRDVGTWNQEDNKKIKNKDTELMKNFVFNKHFDK
jgi:hypothetical protein